MERFVNQCVVYDVMIGHKYTLDDLQKTPDIWTMVTSHASPVLGFLYKEGNNPGAILTCKAGATKLNQLWVDQIAKATALYGSRVNNRTLTAAAFNSDLLSGAKLLSGSLALASSATDLLKQEMMINAIEEASNNKLSELGSASNYAATKALLQQRSAYAAAGEIAARTLPLFKNVIEALSYALFIFIVVLGLLPNGYRTVLTYCGILAWTQLWAPLYAVLNLIMTLYGKHESMGHGLQDGLTLLNSSAIINANADMVTLAAWLSVSIPFISYGILKQGAAAFVGLAQHLGSAMQSAASGAAAETVSGNISLGNVSMGTQAYQNTSAFQHNTSPSYTASQFKALSPAGIEQSTFGDGSQSLSTQALSRLSVQIMGTENTSFAQQDHLSEATTLLQSKTTAANNAAESASQDTTNFLSSVGNTISAGTDLHQGVSASDLEFADFFKGTEAANFAFKNSDKTTHSIRSVLSAQIEGLRQLETSQETFSIRNWVRNENQTGCLFITARADQRQTLTPLISAWVDMAINALMVLPENYDRRLWFVIDELASLQRLPRLQTGLAEGRKYGACFLVGFQSKPQLEDIYGRNQAESMLDLFNTKLFFRCTEPSSQQWISRVLGDKEEAEPSENISYGANSTRDGVSLSRHTRQKPIVIPAELSQLQDLECYIKLPGDYPCTKLQTTFQKAPSLRTEPFLLKPERERDYSVSSTTEASQEPTVPQDAANPQITETLPQAPEVIPEDKENLI